MRSGEPPWGKPLHPMHEEAASEAGWDAAKARKQRYKLGLRLRGVPGSVPCPWTRVSGPIVHTDEMTSWSIGHHAGRLFALREARYDVSHGRGLTVERDREIQREWFGARPWIRHPLDRVQPTE